MASRLIKLRIKRGPGVGRLADSWKYRHDNDHSRMTIRFLCDNAIMKISSSELFMLPDELSYENNGRSVKLKGEVVHHDQDHPFHKMRVEGVYHLSLTGTGIRTDGKGYLKGDLPNPIKLSWIINQGGKNAVRTQGEQYESYGRRHPVSRDALPTGVPVKGLIWDGQAGWPHTSYLERGTPQGALVTIDSKPFVVIQNGKDAVFLCPEEYIEVDTEVQDQTTNPDNGRSPWSLHFLLSIAGRLAEQRGKGTLWGREHLATGGSFPINVPKTSYLKANLPSWLRKEAKVGDHVNKGGVWYTVIENAQDSNKIWVCPAQYINVDTYT